MGVKKATCTVDDLNRLHSSCDERSRVRLSQLLLYGLQYQNSQEAVAEWREYLFVLSATTMPDAAVRYALGHHHKDPSPDRAFVLEYAPPCAGHLFERMTNILAEFKGLDFGEWFPDRDAEVLIPFAMLPHYVLGYSTLRRASDHTGGVSYEARFTPNPAFESNGCSLERPPDLEEAQERKRGELNTAIAWAYHQWTGADDDEWFALRSPHGDQDISGSAPRSR